MNSQIRNTFFCHLNLAVFFAFWIGTEHWYSGVFSLIVAGYYAAMFILGFGK